MIKGLRNLKNILIFSLLIIILGISAINGQEYKTKIWSTGSAYILPQKRVEIGLFQPLRYGYSENLEWSSHPITFFIMPNLTFKWAHSLNKDYAIATRHSTFYPTYLLRTISREGTGGIISPEFDIPHMFAINNEVLVSKPLGKEHLLTGKVGIAFGIKFGKLDERTTIDLPLVYYRLIVFYHGYQLRFGADLQGKIYNRWNYLFDADIFYIPGVEHNKAFEHKGLIIWNKSKNTQISIGYKLIYGEYPFGPQWHFFAPVFDLQKAWSRKK